MPGSGLLDNLLSLIGNAGASVGGAAATPPKRTPQAAAVPYAGYQTAAQQQASANAQADAGLAPQLAELKRLRDAARQQATAQGLLNTAAADAAAGVVKNGPNAGAAYAQSAGLSDAFLAGYQKTLADQMPGQTGQDASQVLGALAGGAGNLFRTQGKAAADSQDNAVQAIVGRGQLGQIAAQAQGNKAVSDLDAQRLGIMAQRPGLYQQALGRIEGQQASLSSAQSKAVQARIEAAYKQADDLSKSGTVYTVDPSTGEVFQLKDEQGQPVLTTSERGQQALQKSRDDQLALTRTALGLKAQNQDFTQKTTTARLALDQDRVRIAGRALANSELKAERAAARQGDLDAYRQAKDQATSLTRSGVVYTVTRTKTGYAVAPALDGRGRPLLTTTSKPAGQKGGLTVNQKTKLRGTAYQIADGAFNGAKDAKGNDLPPVDFQAAVDELAKEGIGPDSPYFYSLGLPALNRWYKPGERGRGFSGATLVKQPGVRFSLGPAGEVLAFGPDGTQLGPIDPFSPGFAQARKRAIQGT